MIFDTINIFFKKIIYKQIKYWHKFLFRGLSKLYVYILTFIAILIGGNLILQSISNKIYTLKKEKNEIKIQISKNEALISKKIIHLINNNQGNNINPSQVIEIKPIPKVKETFWQKMKKKIFAN